MKRLIVISLCAGVLFGMPGPIVWADISPERVRKSIDRGVSFLKKQQQNNGSWSEWVNQPGGVTALCTLALLNSGVPADDPHIVRALGNLRKIRPKATYATVLQTMVFCKAEPRRDILLISRNVKWLENTQIQKGPRKGAWSYPFSQAAGDNSNSQFALLGLYEAQRVGVDVSGRTWRLAKAYWEGCQNVDGSWGYHKGLSGTGSMTCAGIASLVITSDRVRQSAAVVVGDRVECCGQKAAQEDRIERGLQWLGRNFSVTSNRGVPGQTWLFYYLYGVERVGRLTAQRFIGGHDWYREGTEHLLAKQDSLSGFFKGSSYAESDPVIGTSLALLFLSKGRRPTLLAKLEHGPVDDWQRHPGDVGNLTRHVETSWKMDLTWQVVDVSRASVEDLLQSPVLYFCGSRSPLPPEAQQRRALAEKLRAYLDAGGFLFAEAYCGGAGFDRGMRELVELMFPEPEYRLRAIDPGHPIWRAEEAIAPDQLRPLLGIEFGCRTSVIYAPVDPPGGPRPSMSCLWELARPGRQREHPAVVKRQVKSALDLGTNILAYATNRQLQGKEQIFETRQPAGQDDQFERGRLYVAKLRHGGACNAAPRALVNLLETASRELKLRTAAREEPLAVTDPALMNFHLVFMHGRNSFRLSNPERQQLREFIERGGMLFADSICASRAFTESFRREMASLFPENKLQPIPGDDRLWSPAYGGYDLKTVERRDPRSSGDGPLRAKLQRVKPEMEGIRLGERWAVVFSPYDVSCALEKHDSLECRGYTRRDAARLVLNVLLYSLQQ